MENRHKQYMCLIKNDKNRKTPLFQGTATMMVTPFANSRLWTEALRELVEFQIEAGVQAIVMAGTAGEGPGMDDGLRREVIEAGIRLAEKRVKVLVAVGGPDVAYTVKLVSWACREGADGFLVVPPYYAKTSEEGLYQYYMEIAEHSEVPIILSNIPARTGLTLSAGLCERLAEHPMINGVKEVSGNTVFSSEVMRRCKGKLYVWTGNDDQIVPLIAMGAQGIFSTAANLIPREICEMVEKMMWGSVEERRAAAEQQVNYMELFQAQFWETHPIPIKTAMREAGFPVGEFRPPLIEMNRETWKKMKEAIQGTGIDVLWKR